VLYPGQVLLEGTNLSEGRGTTLPFEQCGAPWIDPFALAADLSHWPAPGVIVRPVRFVPTFDKYQGQSCGGVAFQIVEGRAVRSVALTIALLGAVLARYRGQFQWLPPPYEYEWTKPPIDILFGSPRLRERLDRPAPLTSRELDDLLAFDESNWWRGTHDHHLYRGSSVR
jgi:uncharacterized protein YbbC (DUF1343 family)